MKRRRHTSEQAVRKVREGERMVCTGSDLADVLRYLEITEGAYRGVVGFGVEPRCQWPVVSSAVAMVSRSG